MLRALVFLAFAAPCIAAPPYQSWPEWKAAYETAVASKSGFEVKLLNKDIEGTVPPTDTSNHRQDLWTWFSAVHAGTEKTAAQSLMSTTFAGLGGDSSLLTAFNSQVAIQLSTAGTTSLKNAYDQYYEIIGVKKATTTALIPLHRQFHSMSAEQQKSAKTAMQLSLGTQWDNKWGAGTFTSWTGATTYAAKTGIVYNILKTDTAQTGNANGQPVYDAYKAAHTNNDKEMLSMFESKMAAKLRAGLD